MKKIILYILFNFYYFILFSQNTVGVINNTNQAFNGYTLFTAQTETYLIDNCGKIINQWSSSYPPGNAVYLLENGNLLRAAKIENPHINFGGTGGRIELFNWYGNIIWEYEYNTNQVRQHHDIYPMPNGNILILAATVISNQEAIDMGRNPNNLSQSVLYNEQILEIEPQGTNSANIVWEWNIKDHLIQDMFPEKDNFGIIKDHPELLDINYDNTNGSSNWLHINSMQYYEPLDQIIISSRFMSEIYIIDHSTTTIEAASHSGGTYGKGGDFLYRWGNPQAYNQGDTMDQKLFGQHFPHFIPNNLLDEGKIILYNNGFNRDPDFSEIFILSPPTDSPGVYSYSGGAFGPIEPDFTYVDPEDPLNFYSAILSGAQRLPNDNILICEGISGRFFEVDNNGNKVWEYISPVGAFGILNQGDDPSGKGNTVFRAFKYSPSYSAFNGRDLTPGNTIESGMDMNGCNILNINNNIINDLEIFPLPTKDLIYINSKSQINKIEVFDLLGKLVSVFEEDNIEKISIGKLTKGIYLLKISSNNLIISKKIIKK